MSDLKNKCFEIIEELPEESFVELLETLLELKEYYVDDADLVFDSILDKE